MNPIFSRRILVRASSFSPPSVCPSMLTRPEVARSSPPSRFRSVDLPEPDGPTIDTSCPRGIATVTSFSAATSRRPPNCLHTLARSIIARTTHRLYRLEYRGQQIRGRWGVLRVDEVLTRFRDEALGRRAHAAAGGQTDPNALLNRVDRIVEHLLNTSRDDERALRGGLDRHDGDFAGCETAGEVGGPELRPQLSNPFVREIGRSVRGGGDDEDQGNAVRPVSCTDASIDDLVER